MLRRRLGHQLLVIEDVHWADEATIEFLLFLTTQPGHRPSLVLSYRPEDVPADALLRRLPARLPAQAPRLRLSLAPLDQAATARLLSALLGGEPVSPELVSFLHRHTAGIPLALEELVRVMCERADLPDSGHCDFERTLP